MKLIIDIPDRIQYGIEKGITQNGSVASKIVLNAVKDGVRIPEDITEEECKVCTKDGTKCGICPIMLAWIVERKKANEQETSRQNKEKQYQV